MDTSKTQAGWEGSSTMDEHPVQMQLGEYVNQIVDLAVTRTVPATVRACFEEHLKTCPKDYLISIVEKLDARVDKIELKFATLVGLMIGSGVCGGAVSGTLIYFVGG